jgi:chorismate-pyruvate lyase
VDWWEGTPGTRIEGDRQCMDQDQRMLGHVPVGEVLRHAALLRRGDAHVATSPHHRNDQAVCLTRQRQAREAMRGV